MLLVLPFSPLIMLVVSAIAYFVVVYSKRPHAPVKRLVIVSLMYAGIMLVVSLLLTIAWMIWYQYSTGYDAGNAIVGWIFFFAPASVALGQLIGLVQWLRS